MNVILIDLGAPQNLQEESILTYNYILNKIPHKKLEKISYELWKGRRHSYKYLKLMRCLAKIVVHDHEKVKIGRRTMDCVFIEYAYNSNAYQFPIHK